MARITAQNYQSYMKGSNRHIDTHTREMYLGDSPTVQAGYGTYDSKETAHKVACYMFSLDDSATASTPCEDIPRGFTVAIEENNTVVEYQYKKPMPSGGYTAADLEVKELNVPDEEDITSVDVMGTNVLKLKDKSHNSLLYSGLGRVYLRKNIVNGTNILTQDMLCKGDVGSRVPNTNTIFIVQYDYSLNEQTIEVPEGCVLQFDGGSISNGTITGSNTVVSANLVKIFNTDLDFNGTWKIKEIFPEWFGAVADYVRTETSGDYVETGTDNTDAFIKACSLCNLTHSKVYINAASKPYGISLTKRIDVTPFSYVNIEGAGMGMSVLKMMTDNIRGIHGTNSNAELRLANFTIIGRHEENPTLGDNSDRPIVVAAKRGLAENVEVLHSRQMSLSVGGWLDCRVIGCHVEYSARDCISVVGNVNIQVSDCIVRHGHDDAIAFHRDIYSGTITDSFGNIKQTTGGTVLGTSVIITNNIFEDVNGVVGLGAVNTIIANNVFKMMKGYAIRVGGGNSSYQEQGNNSSSNIDIHDNIIIGCIGANRDGGSTPDGFPIWIGAKTGIAGMVEGDSVNPLYSVLYKNQSTSSTGDSADYGTINLSVHSNLILGTVGNVSYYSEFGVGYRFKQNGGMTDVAITGNGSSRAGIYIDQMALTKLSCYDNTISGCFSAFLIANANIDHTRIYRNAIYDCTQGISFGSGTSIYNNGEMILEENDFNLDPFFTRGSYTSTRRWNDITVYAISVHGMSWNLILKGNYFQNLCRPIHGIRTSGFTHDEGNTYVLDLVGNTIGTGFTRGVGLIIPNRGNKYIFKDLDPTSANYNEVKAIKDAEFYSDAIPEPPLVNGMRVINTNPSNGIAYWITSGHVVNTTNAAITSVKNQISGTNENRPTENIIEGLVYYDTTLKKPIWWNGNRWIDANGDAVDWSVAYTLSHATASNTQPPIANVVYSTVLTADEGYILPLTITVTMGGNTLVADTDYLYDYTTGVVTILGSGGSGGVTADITISATAIVIQLLSTWTIVGNSEVHSLPSGYTKCKYLEFHGTECINSNVYTKEGIGMAVTFQTDFSDANTVFGARKDYSNSGFTIGFNSSHPKVIQAGYGSYTRDIVMASSYRDGNVHTVYLDSEQAQVDGAPINLTRGTFTNFYKIVIGARNNAGGIADKYTGKIYSAIIYDTQQVLFNGIPCLDANNVPCLYDTVSQTAFYNLGTGTFGYEVDTVQSEVWSCGELGTDSKYHIKVVSNGAIFDISLNEPLRKYGTAEDSIEYANNVAVLTRKVEEVDGELNVLATPTTETITVPEIIASLTDSYTQKRCLGCKAVGWTSFGDAVIPD